MAGSIRRRWSARLGLAAVLASLAFAVLGASPSAPSVDALSRWTGGVDLYRSGVFTTQKTWLWCTAADVQIIRNIVDHRAITRGRASSGTSPTCAPTTATASPSPTASIPPAGPPGCATSSTAATGWSRAASFDSALRSAVTNLRKTNLPVAITVSHGNHAWVLTGFTATADPAKTSRSP